MNEPWPILPGDDDPAAFGSDPDFLLPARIGHWARVDPERPFLTEVGGRTVSYHRFQTETVLWRDWLVSLGVRSGDRIASLLSGSIDAHLLWLAAASLGVYEVAVSPDLRGSFLRHVVVDSKASLAVVRPEQAGLLAEAGVDTSVRVEVVERGWSPATAGIAAAADPAAVAASVSPAPTDVSCVIYTSGTTGDAKGVVISHGQLAAIVGRIPRSWLDETDVVYAPWPMAHVTGRSPAVVMADVGGQVVLRERFSLTDFWSDVERYRCTSATVAAVVPLLLAVPPRPDDADNPLRTGWFAKLDDQVLEFCERFGIVPLSSYGSTEAGFPVVHRDIRRETLDVTGRLRPGYQARVVDPKGVDVPPGEPGEPGELLIRPPVPHLVLLGYLDRPEMTEKALGDGWFRTGDAVTLSADGALRFVDRLADTIRRFGESISATALETAISSDPEIMECTVLGVPSSVSGQQVLLVVAPKPGVALEPAALWQRLSSRLPRFMLPAEIGLVDELPRSPNGKVRKRVLAGLTGTPEVWQAPTRAARQVPPVR